MGCGSSKLEHVGDVIMLPAKIRPMIVRKVEEIKRHARNSIGSVTSRKELLNDTSGYHRCDFYVDSSRGSSTTMNDNSLKRCENALSSSEQCEEFKDAVENLSETPIIGSPKAKTPIEFEDKVNKVAAEFLAWSEMRAESKNYMEEEEIEVVEDEEENSEGEDLRQRRICPGSPSFRVYYVESLASTIKDDGSFAELDNEIENERHKEVEKKRDSDMIPEELVKHKKGIMRTMRKQGGKLKRVIITKPKSMTATKLLKVPSCAGKSTKRIETSKPKF
ncbi:unnamed protein product [Linum trigynum]|uniref:Uncharacterized protein n=1 Tax=Linum trigynum TaxID=586398 RepID=A0AAV2G639_9ROSI